MSRFLGGENPDQNPYMRLRVGRIEAIYYDKTAPGVRADENTNLDVSLGKALVSWLDWGGKRDMVQLSFPSFSNAQVDSSSEGICYGDISMPSVGDIALIGFRDPSTAVILGYLAANYNKQTLDDISVPTQFGNMRRIVPGELSRKSRQQAEIYQDKAGAVQIIVKAQPVTTTNSPAQDGSDTDEVADIKQTVNPTVELARVTIGETYTDETFSERRLIDPTDTDTKVVAEVKMASGAFVRIDTGGNVVVACASGKMLIIGDEDYVLDDQGTRQKAARETDATLSNSSTDSAFWTFMSNLFAIFNAHTHSAAGSGPPTTPLTGLPTSQTGKINSGSDTVRIT